jgi:segregation and condensation protein A
MTEPEFAAPDPFEAAALARPEEALILELDGFEGPLDLLLMLARTQKVDLAKISVLQLADQYLAFMESARKHSLELAADYLVMAAWLAYLKSRLVLPQAHSEESASAEEAAAQLRWRLQRLEVMREAGVRLVARERLDRDVFARGSPEPVRVVKLRRQTDTLYDLLTAYSTQRIKQAGHKVLQVVHPPILLIEEARERLERLIGKLPDWAMLTRFIPLEWRLGQRRRSALASTLSASLELARDGRLEIQQLSPFGDIFIKDRAAAEES